MPARLDKVFTTFSNRTPMLFVDIDREMAKQMKVSLGDVFNTLNANMGSVYINQFNEFGRIWQVNIQSEGKYRANLDDLRLIYVRNQSGDPVPLASPWPSSTIRGRSLSCVTTT